MELIITIPKEFEAHFKQDKFKDSLGRICYDIENAFKKQEGVSGRYEHELAEMLDEAFAKAQVSPTEAKLKRALYLARAELCRRLDVDRYLRKHRNSWYNENCLTWNEACVAMKVKMRNAENKCQSYANKFNEE